MTVHIPVDMNKVFLILIDYNYDDLSRLIEADYNNSATVYNYGYADLCTSDALPYAFLYLPSAYFINNQESSNRECAILEVYLFVN